MAESISRSYGPKRRATKQTIPQEWHPVMDVTGHCVYCGHCVRDHQGLALGFAAPGHKRRQFLGVQQVDCRACAAEKGTAQVICYVINGSNIQ